MKRSLRSELETADSLLVLSRESVERFPLSFLESTSELMRGESESIKVSGEKVLAQLAL